MQKVLRSNRNLCSAFGCDMKRRTNLVEMFYFPKDPERRARWATAIKRKNWKPSDSCMLCNSHFITGKPSADPRHPDFIPSLFCFDKKHMKVENKKIPVSEKRINHSTESTSELSRSHRKPKSIKPAINKENKREKLKYSSRNKSSVKTGNKIVETVTIESQDEGNDISITEETTKTKPKQSSPKVNGVDKVVITRLDFASEIAENVKRRALEDEVSKNIAKKKKVDSAPPSNINKSVPKVIEPAEPDREDIFGQYVASEMKGLKENPLLYLQTKQTILEILTSANFEFLNPE